MFEGITKSIFLILVFVSQIATTGIPTFDASLIACWSTVGSVTINNFGSIYCLISGFVSVPETNLSKITLHPVYFAKFLIGSLP